MTNDRELIPIDAARAGSGLDGVIPVNVPPTAEYADMLEGRPDFPEKELIQVPAEDLESDR